jgi:hypothetical protein
MIGLSANAKAVRLHEILSKTMQTPPSIRRLNRDLKKLGLA